MNAAVMPEVLLRGAVDAQPELPLASAGVQRYLWEGRYGAILVEVEGDEIRVNGERVQPCPG